MSVKLTTSLSQRLVLTPQLRQRIEMLQMTSLELSELIQQQLLENPVLEEVQTQDEQREIEKEILDQLASEPDDAARADELGERAEEFGEESVGEEQPRDAFEEIDFGREFQDYLDPGYKTQEFEYKEDAPTFEQFLTRPPSLAEHLEWQLHLNPIDSQVCDAALCVIGNLDTDGRLNATNEAIAALGGWPAEQVEAARQIV